MRTHLPTRWALAALAASAATAVLGAAPARAVEPALAAVAANVHVKDGCTVTAVKPYFLDISPSGVKRAQFKVTASCSAGRSITVEHEGYDYDPGDPDDLLFANDYGPAAYTSAGTKTWLWNRSITHLDGAGDPVVELYHRVRFQVSGGGITGSWTPWFSSATLNFQV